MKYFVYRGPQTAQISFPLGGIGTGCIGLAGNGRLIDWEIFNRPNKGSVNGFSHFAIKAEAGDRVLDARILHGDLAPPYQGELHAPRFSSFGWGPRREYLTGLPHFRETEFHGAFPLAKLIFQHENFPGQVEMHAFNPFIPLNDKDSGLPAAFFEFEITNPTTETLQYTLVGVLANPLPAPNLNRVTTAPWGHTLYLASDGLQSSDPGYGNLTLATDAGLQPDTSLSWQQYWFRGTWFDSLEVYWRDLTTPGPFKNRVYPPEAAGAGNEGLLAASFSLPPGATKSLRYLITWHFPTCERYWKEPPPGASPPTWKNYYATLWSDSQESARYALENWDRLADETRMFTEALCASDLPPVALDAVSANISILKSPTVLRLEDGTFYGWEGCHPDAGCCEGSCTHVWNYAQALPLLFPALERSMREVDYRFNQRPDGGMTFRLMLPLGTPPQGVRVTRPCADGQFGNVLKTYRDWKISGDSEWLRQLWPAVKKAIAFAWHPENEDRWDPEQTGVLWGRQHHTLDMELFGPNAWLTGFYLGALKAGAEMAEHLGEPDTAAQYRAIFQRGKAWVDQHLFNGQYYIQQIDLTDKSLVEAFDGTSDTLVGATAISAYWDEEHGEIKYQIAEGCSIDQVVAQWHANLYGLGEILDPDQVREANKAIFQHNFIPVMREAYNPCRIYSLNDESGLVICAWPAGAKKPTIPVPYSQETMNGFEYAAAIHMIQSGLIEEGMNVVEAIRKRYDGKRRNPWNEFECGNNYARSMASFALLQAFAGFQYDMAHHTVGFNPCQLNEGQFRCFWSLDSGWGEFETTRTSVELRVLYGHLDLQTLHLPFLSPYLITQVTHGETTVESRFENGRLTLPAIIRITPAQMLHIAIRSTNTNETNG